MRTMRDVAITLAVLLASAVTPATRVGKQARWRARTRIPPRGLLGVAALGGGVLGAAIGGSVALLFAPAAGSHTRQRLREMATGMRDRTLDATANLRDRAGDAVERGRGVLAHQRTILSASFEAGREAMRRERDRLGAG
jgi:gas vesicle protein